MPGVQTTLLKLEGRIAEVSVDFTEEDGYTVDGGCGVICHSSGRPTASWQKTVEWMWESFLKRDYAAYKLKFRGHNKLKDLPELQQVIFLKQKQAEK